MTRTTRPIVADLLRQIDRLAALASAWPAPIAKPVNRARMSKAMRAEYEDRHRQREGFLAEWTRSREDAHRQIDALVLELAKVLSIGGIGAQAYEIPRARVEGKSASDVLTMLADGVLDDPPCVVQMGCLCAGHARGNPATAPCDTRETVTREDRGEPDDSVDETAAHLAAAGLDVSYDGKVLSIGIGDKEWEFRRDEAEGQSAADVLALITAGRLPVAPPDPAAIVDKRRKCLRCPKCKSDRLAMEYTVPWWVPVTYAVDDKGEAYALIHEGADEQGIEGNSDDHLVCRHCCAELRLPDGMDTAHGSPGD